jgi:seryl-tRNA synthetase
MVGATTLDEYRERIEKDPALERRFQQVLVAEPTVEDTIAILRGLKGRYEAHHKVQIADSALVAAATLSDRYITSRFLPDKAIDLVDEAASRLRMEIDSSPVEIDELQRAVDRLKMEEMALANESDAGSRERLARLRRELADREEELRALEAELTSAEQEREGLSLRVPNVPHESVPDGATEEDAAVVRTVGEPPALDQPREHTEIGRFDMDRAARIAGSRFGYWVGGTALVALALYRFALDRLVTKGFVAVLPPVLVREEALIGTGWFPTEEANVYEIDGDELYLAGTAEIPLGGLHLDEILQADELPLRYVGFSPCFRREAGAAGRDTRGMFRVHQFNKVEQFSFTRPENSWEEHEFLLANTEELVRELGLPYRIVILPAGDMSTASAKTYDVEIWFPFQRKFRETASISNTTDFQARRLGTRYRGERGVAAVHTLNGTAVVDRMALAILENFQGEVPPVLREYGAPQKLGN